MEPIQHLLIIKKMKTLIILAIGMFIGFFVNKYWPKVKSELEQEGAKEKQKAKDFIKTTEEKIKDKI
ncbi:hypothetical protein D6B99_11635 [Arachidicoccus soli]|uniref:Uncharacterized protein n=2 Tax=Arachidicoccus soli TaxID=2341117 RepID=A0A386HRB1_9BACT|nr:hypothetical protein D6B99_11635 [Arachidicoccus soli]